MNVRVQQHAQAGCVFPCVDWPSVSWSRPEAWWRSKGQRCHTECLCVCSTVFSLYSAGMLMHKCFCLPPADPHKALNGNHDSKINSMAKTLQDSLVLKTSSSPGIGKHPVPPDMLNGTSNSKIDVSIYENSSSFLGHNLDSKTPARLPHTNHTPVPHPRPSLSVAASGTSGSQKAQESPKPLRNARAEATSCPTQHIRGSGQSAENLSQSHKPSSIKFYPKTPSSPQLRGSTLQKRSQSPLREQVQSLSHVDISQRVITPDSSGSTALRVPGRGTSGSQGSALPLPSQGFNANPILESPQGNRKLTTPSKAEVMRVLYAQSPSPLPGLEKEQGSRQSRPTPGNAMVSSLGSASGLSPVASPHSVRKTSFPTAKGSSGKDPNLPKPYTRERKNSISEISDNEDKLLEYHRWQREERLREQEMEKLVSEHQYWFAVVETSISAVFNLFLAVFESCLIVERK